MLLVASLCAASMWFYVDQILVVYQREDAAAHERPRGDFSDLYPRWLGARELLLHHRNPYSDDITAEIQKGYYGRTLDSTRPNDPKDQAAFAYPVYVAFLLAPLIALPFSAVMAAFYWFLAILTGVSVWLWLRALQWRLSPSDLVVCIVFTLGSFSAVQGIKLQQLSLLVAALLAASTAATVNGSLFLGGGLLALATIKPQLAWPLAVWLLLWTISDWRARRRFIFGFTTVFGALLVAAELVLPGWWRLFVEAAARYQQYTHNQPVIEVMLNQVLGSPEDARIGGTISAVVAILGSASILWKLRREGAGTRQFATAIALVLALTVLVVPTSAPYNQILFLPAIFLLIRERVAFSSQSRARRLSYGMGVCLLGWQWVASLCLAAVYFVVSPRLALTGWRWPFYTTLALPVWIFVSSFLYARQRTSITKREAVIAG